VNAQDVVLAMSFPRHSQDTLELVDFARQRGAWTAGVTDSRAAPLASRVDLALMAPSQHPKLPASMIACLALLEALVAEVMRLHPQATVEAMNHTVAVFPHLVGREPPIVR
jgi:DNA-binding MurR/RpiR family transcriptional regulator